MTIRLAQSLIFFSAAFLVGSASAPGHAQGTNDAEEIQVDPPGSLASQGADTTPGQNAANDVLTRQFKQGVEAYDAKRYSRAFELWLPLAQNGDLAAQRNVAHLLRRGLGVEQDLRRARNFYKQSAEFGFVTAQTNLGVMLIAGEGGDEDPEQAAYWLDRAARGGHPVAQFHLARLYETGSGVAPNPGRALGWYALAARSGHQPSLDRLAELVMILPGPSTQTSTSDDPNAPIQAGDMQPDKQTEVAAREEIAPEAPDMPAPEATDFSSEVDEPAQPASAKELQIPETPENENAGETASPQLDQVLEHYSARRFKEAQSGFETLAYKGDLEAQYRLGRMRNRGEGEPRDPVAALAWWTVAAEAGHSKAERAAKSLSDELGPRRRGEADREAAQFKALISQLTSRN